MKTVVITGGNKGLGLAQTRCFLYHGYQVHVIARSNGDLGAVSSDHLHWHEHDLADWADVSYLDAIHADAGPIDALVNNAGVHLKLPIWEVEASALDTVLDINVKAMFLACGRYCDLQADTGGAVINISSMGGLMGLPSAAAYVTAKTAVIGLTRAVAVDAAARGIRCNAVCPGFIDTDMTRAVLAKDPARREKIEGRIPTHRFGTAQNVADAVHFLASDASTYINGVALPVDGGYAIGF
ncbi:MAG: SDR family NAD(P)-dependent oxidoreductase [Hyphomicrobiales bacterium]